MQIDRRIYNIKSAGVSLIEMMVAMALGMLLIIVVGYAYLGSSKVFSTLDSTSRMQEGARFAFEQIGYDLRMVGFSGCTYSTSAKPINSNAYLNNYLDLFNQPLFGYEEGESVFPSDSTDSNIELSSNRLRGDAITILRTDTSREYTVTGSSTLTTSVTHDFTKGSILVVNDCSHAAIIQMTSATGTAATPTSSIGHATSGASPGNSTENLGPSGNVLTFTNSARIYPLSSNTYYIRNNIFGEPSLYRQRLNSNGTNAIPSPEEVVEGVENMQISYGVDTDAIADGAVNRYVDAHEIAGLVIDTSKDAKTGSETSAQLNWKRVLSIKIKLTMVSRSDESIAQGSADKLLRKEFTTTIALRNRL